MSPDSWRMDGVDSLGTRKDIGQKPGTGLGKKKGPSLIRRWDAGSAHVAGGAPCTKRSD